MHTVCESFNEIFIQIVNDMAFMCVEPANKNKLQNTFCGYLRACINFSGHASGNLSLIAPVEMSHEFVSNVLGVDIREMTQTEVPAITADALGEFANVLCGNTLSAIAGNKPTFNLNPPVVSRASLSAWQDMQQQYHSMAFLVEDDPILIALSFTPNMT